MSYWYSRRNGHATKSANSRMGIRACENTSNHSDDNRDIAISDPKYVNTKHQPTFITASITTFSLLNYFIAPNKVKITRDHSKLYWIHLVAPTNRKLPLST